MARRINTLRRTLTAQIVFRFVCRNKRWRQKRLRTAIRAVLPDHKLYDLRTTFYTRCMECGVAEPAMKAFVGHSFGQLGDAYTDLSDEYLLQEGAKLLY